MSKAVNAKLNVLISAALVIIMILWSYWTLLPPNPLPAEADLEQFSAGRALAHLEKIAVQPRIPGSSYHSQVRDYLVGQLQHMGLETHVQEYTYIMPDRSNVPFRSCHVRNIVSRIEGYDSSGAILLAAHYDSVSSGTGAGDDAMGVAAVLEAVRALIFSGQPKNDIIVLFSDGHEYGLFGAKAFAEQHSWANDVQLIFNFEGQGPTGPVYMFETSRNNRWLVEEFAQAVPRPMTDSFSYDIYQLLNFDNDFRIFMDNGYSGLGFAAIADMAYYHSELDNLERLNLRTLQHQGSYALGLGRHFGNLDLTEIPQGDSSVFFNYGRLLIHYPSGWALPLAVTAVALAVLVLLSGLLMGKLRLAGWLTGLALHGIILGTGLVLAVAVRWIFGLNADTYRSPTFFSGLICLSLAIAFFAILSGKKLLAKEWAGAGMVWLTVAVLASGFAVPNGSHLFVWPLIFLALSMAAVMLLGQKGEERQWLLITAGIIPGLLMLAPLVWMVFTALTLSMAVAGMGLLLILTLLAVPVMQPLVLWGQKQLSIALALGSVLILLWAGLSGYNPKYPQHYDLFYVQDTAGQAYWASSDPVPHPWVQHFTGSGERMPLPQIFPYSGRTYFQADTESLELEPPEVQVVEDSTSNGIRTLRLQLTSPRGGHCLTVYLEKGTMVMSTSLNGNHLTDRFQADWIWALEVLGVAEEGIELEFQVLSGQAVKLLVVDLAHDAPLPGRPDYLIKRPKWPYLSNGTFVAAEYNFD